MVQRVTAAGRVELNAAAVPSPTCAPAPRKRRNEPQQIPAQFSEKRASDTLPERGEILGGAAVQLR